MTTTHEAVTAVMRDIGEIVKGRKADSSQGGYAFRGIEEVLNAIGPAFRTHGVISATEVIGDPIISEYETSGGRTQNWVMLKVQVTLRGNPDDPDDKIVASHWGEAGDNMDKAASKAYSVGYREAMLKTLAMPTSGDDYDTEQGEDKERAGRAEKEAAALAKAEAEAKERGFESLDDLEANWRSVKEMCTATGESGEWARNWAKAMGFKPSTITANGVAEMETTMANAKKDGDWKAGYAPESA